EAAFVQHARSWADDNEVPPSAFVSMGVPAEVLEAAGLAPAEALEARSTTTVEHVKAAIGGLDGRFTHADVVRAAGGGSPMTVRKAVTEMVAGGQVARIGPDPEWHARG